MSGRRRLERQTSEVDRPDRYVRKNSHHEPVEVEGRSRGSATISLIVRNQGRTPYLDVKEVTEKVVDEAHVEASDLERYDGYSVSNIWRRAKPHEIVECAPAGPSALQMSLSPLVTSVFPLYG